MVNPMHDLPNKDLTNQLSCVGVVIVFPPLGGAEGEGPSRIRVT